jgi:hypothetical protein
MSPLRNFSAIQADELLIAYNHLQTGFHIGFHGLINARIDAF